MTMDASAVARFLDGLIPTRLEQRAGCVLWPEDDAPSEEKARARVAELTSTFRAMRFENAAGRARSSYMRDFNRRFVRNELEWRGLTEVRDEQLAFFAELWADLLRARVPALVPETSITVEVIGLDDIEDEPLEVAVTFFVDPAPHVEAG